MRAAALTLLLALGSAATAETPLSFREALALARTKNQRLRASAARVDGAREARDAQKGLYYPTVSAYGLYSHMNDDLFVDLNSLRPLLSALNPAVPIPPLTATVLENDPYRVGLNARWTVYAGGRISAANRGAEALVTAAEQEHRATEDGITTELVDRYFKRRLAAAALEVRRQAVDTFTRHLEDARRLGAAGQIARKDELRAEVALAEAERSMKKALRDLELASVALNATLGDSIDAAPTTPLSLITEVEPLEAFEAAAVSGNPTTMRLAALQDGAHQGTRAANGELFPSVNVLGTYEFFERGLNSTADPKWAVGLAVRWEIFDGFGRSHRVRALRKLEDGLGLEQEHAQHQVATLVEQRFDEYVSAREQYESLQSTLALAEESLRTERKAFEGGVGTSLDVVDAELSLARTQIDRLTALYELGLSLARLLEASGQGERFSDYLDRGTPAEKR